MKALNFFWLLPLVLTLAESGIGESNTSVSEKGKFVILKQDDGNQQRAFIAGPADAKAGVLVVHDYFGISDATKQYVERLSALGGSRSLWWKNLRSATRRR